MQCIQAVGRMNNRVEDTQLESMKKVRKTDQKMGAKLDRMSTVASMRKRVRAWKRKGGQNDKS